MLITIKKANLFFIGLFFCLPVFGQIAPNSDAPTFVLPDLRVRLITQSQNFTWLSELSARQGLNGRARYHISAGSRYKIARNFRLGIHYKGQINNRNNENWILEPGIWRFNEESNDLENIISPEFSMRFLLTSSLRLELRNLYEFNLLFHQQNLRSNLTFDYFISKQSDNHKSLYLTYEIVLPTNYARHQINETWYYLGYRFGVSQNQSLGLSLSYVEWVWTESDEFKVFFPTRGYRTTDQAIMTSLHWVFGLNL